MVVSRGHLELKLSHSFFHTAKASEALSCSSASTHRQVIVDFTAQHRLLLYDLFAAQVGGSFGGTCGLLLMKWLPGWNIQPGLYAMCAATAMLGGVFRASISLVVLLVEGTQASFCNVQDNSLSSQVSKSFASVHRPFTQEYTCIDKKSGSHQ